MSRVYLSFRKNIKGSNILDYRSENLSELPQVKWWQVAGGEQVACLSASSSL